MRAQLSPIASSLRFIVAAFGAVAFAAMADAAPIIVDDFNQPAGGQTVNSGSLNGSFSAVSGVGILGTRNLSYAGTGPGAPPGIPANNWVTGFEVLSANGATFPGKLAMATFVSAVQVNLNYSGFGTLNASGFQAIQLDFVPVFDKGTAATFDISVTLTTGSGTLTGSISAPGGFAPNGGTLLVPLNSLSGPGSLGSVTGIQVNLNDNGTPSSSADFSLDTISLIDTPVPEPSSVIVMGVVALAGGIVYLRRRHRGVHPA